MTTQDSDTSDKHNNTIDKKSWLLRLFESKLFDMSIAITYLYKSKEQGVLTYIGNKMFSFKNDEIDFYLPQLVTLYIYHQNICDAIFPYFLYRCKNDIVFSLNLVWQLNAFCLETNTSIPLLKRRCPGNKLKKLILSEELWTEDKSFLNLKELENDSSIQKEYNCKNIYLNIKKTHHRSYSEASNFRTKEDLPSSCLNSFLSYNNQIRDLSSGKAFDNNCLCFNSRSAVCNDLRGQKIICNCGAPKLLPEYNFVKCLINIGKRLQNHSSKEVRTQRLLAELQLLNLNLPARVWLPIYDEEKHLIIQIPPNAAVLLNSKDKAPYLIYIEAIKIDDNINSIALPNKSNNTLRQTRSEENLINFSRELFKTKKNNIIYLNDLNKKSKTDNNDEKFITVSEIRKRLTTSINPKNNFDSDPDDPSAAALKEPWDLKMKRIRESSPYGHLPTWHLFAAIIKCGDDLRQEMMAYQVMLILKKIWIQEKVPLWIRPYKIMVFNSECGIIEPILNTISLHQIKKNSKMSLFKYFLKEYGPITSEKFLTAQINFVQSCAAYSIVSYLMQVKDRHNGNILLDSQGHIIHIDYGFILSNSPKNLNFEKSPFKLTQEFVDIMGGVNSEMFNYFKILILQGLIAARKHQEKLITLIEILQINSQLPCFKLGTNAIKSLKGKFHMTLTEKQLQTLVNEMVEKSIDSITTRLYDGFQYFTNGIL